MVSTKKYKLQRVINWYHGNFCTRKCFNKGNRTYVCHLKFERILKSSPNLMITHKDFKDLIDNDGIKICELKPGFRKKTVGWKQFEKWHKDPMFDPDKM